MHLRDPIMVRPISSGFINTLLSFLSSNPCSFHTLSLNNLANPSADVFSVVGIKWTILFNQSTTTRMLLYPCTKDNLVIKSANICVYGFSGIEFSINFSASCSVQFLLHWQALHPSTYHLTSLVIPGHQKF